jgi:hypothetical protein
MLRCALSCIFAAASLCLLTEPLTQLRVLCVCVFLVQIKVCVFFFMVSISSPSTEFRLTN